MEYKEWWQVANIIINGKCGKQRKLYEKGMLFMSRKGGVQFTV